MDYLVLLDLSELETLMEVGEVTHNISKRSKVVIRLVVSEKGEYTRTIG